MTPLGRFSELDFSTTKRVPKITNVRLRQALGGEMFLRSTLLGTGTIPTVLFFFPFFPFFFFKSSLIKSFTLKLKS